MLFRSAPETISKDLFEKVSALPGFGRESKTATSVDLRRNDEWSALVLPIALWPVSPEVRAALLCGELYLACVVRPDAWRDAMKAEGLELAEERQGWTITSASKATHLDVLEVGKLTLGVAFSGVALVRSQGASRRHSLETLGDSSRWSGCMTGSRPCGRLVLGGRTSMTCLPSPGIRTSRLHVR